MSKESIDEVKSMKKIILFGATGKVGNYVLDYMQRYFDRTEYEVIATGRRETDFFDRMHIAYYAVDVRDKSAFCKLPQKDVYAAVILSAQLPTKSNGQDENEQIQTNFVGNANIFAYCKEVGVDRILFCQTLFDLADYFNKGQVLMPDMRPSFSYKDSHAVYVICKNAAIELLEYYHQKFGIKKFVFRLPTIYAYNAWPYMYVDGKQVKRPLYVMIDKAVNSEPLEIWGNPKYAKDMVHVYDFAQMLCKALEVERDNGFYNVGTGKPVTLEEQIRTIVKVFSPSDNPSPIRYAPEKKSDGGCLMNIDNAVEELGYQPQYDCLKLMEDFKIERELNRFAELRTDLRYQ